MAKNKKKDREFHKKLVRDKIPQIIKEAGDEYETRVMGKKEFRKRLREKLVEEAQELLNASKKDLKDELADVLQVIKSIAEFEGIGFEKVEQERKEKEKKRGSFKDRIFLNWSTKQK